MSPADIIIIFSFMYSSIVFLFYSILFFILLVYCCCKYISNELGKFHNDTSELFIYLIVFITHSLYSSCTSSVCQLDGAVVPPQQVKPVGG